MPVPINTGDTAWLMIASSLVLLMIPALGMFEAGLLRQKNAVSVFMQIFFGLALLSVMWFTVGFSLTFGPDTGEGLTGNTDWRFLHGVSQKEGLHYAPTVPGVSFAMFQMMFAVITPLILTGAVAERMRFSAYVLFIVAWSALIYYPLVHWIWGDGWLHKLGVVDFAGGMIIHTTTGVGGIAAALVLGRILGFGPGIMVPHNIPLAVLGSSLLWLGWFGFNAGSAYSAGSLSGITIVNTQMASAVSCLIWVVIFWIRTRKSSIIAAINGAVAGLAGITPASGYVGVEFAVVIGIVVGFASSLMVPILKERLKIDDALDIGAVHGVSGIIGSLLVGVFANSAVNHLGINGWLYGNPGQLESQAIGVGIAVLMGFGGTWVILKILKVLIPIRVSPGVEEAGLDIEEHAERAYSDEEEYGKL
ncbi:MAG: ammonium transporter [Nitrosotalea sp.]